jgi:hypothetical protein
VGKANAYAAVVNARGLAARRGRAVRALEPRQRQRRAKQPDVERPREIDLLRAAERDAIVASQVNAR